MNRKRLLLSLFLFVASCSLAFGQETAVEPRRADEIKDKIAKDIKDLGSLRIEIVNTLQKDDEPFEGYVRGRVEWARKIAIGLQKNLALSESASVKETQPTELPSDTRKNILRSLAKLISDLIANPIFEAVSASDIKQAENMSRQLEALLEFTEPEHHEYGKAYPLAAIDLLNVYSKTDLGKTDEMLDQQAVKLVQKRCVDFIGDGTTFWALRLAGASETLIKEVDSCLTAKSRAVIANRLAATSPDDLKAGNVQIIDGVIRLLVPKKDLVNQKRFLEAAREFLRRFETERDSKEFVDYLKEMIPKVESRIEKMSGPH